jgi:hypothetical protein
MSAYAVTAFLSRLLLREGAEIEPDEDDRLFAVLPPETSRALSVPEAATLCIGGEPAPGEVPFPLEGAGVSWCLDRALSRGRVAAARLGVRSGTSHSRLSEAERRTSLLNATRGEGDVVLGEVAIAVLEFSYEARSEERASGAVHLALDLEGGAPSLALAEAIRGHVPHAAPAPLRVPEDALRAAVDRAFPCALAEATRRLEPFRRQCAARMLVERRRVVEYHDRLVREAASRRRSSLGVGEAEVAARRDAVVRQREERLRELEDRHAVEVVVAPASVLVVRYESASCRLVVRRRRREIPFPVRWDPVLGEFLGPPCAACSRPTLTVAACDDAGHLTCAACSARCGRCDRARCRACSPGGCGCPPAS